MPEFRDQWIACCNDFCSGRVLWTVRQQQGQWYKAGTLNPPRWMCEQCRQEAARFAEKRFPCDICGREFVWDASGQLRAQRTGAAPPTSCKDCRNAIRSYSVTEVPCQYEVRGCRQKLTISGRRRRQLEVAGNWPPTLPCDRCEGLRKRLRDREEPCAQDGCGNTWLWSAEDQFDHILQDRHERPRGYCLQHRGGESGISVSQTESLPTQEQGETLLHELREVCQTLAVGRTQEACQALQRLRNVDPEGLPGGLAGVWLLLEQDRSEALAEERLQRLEDEYGPTPDVLLAKFDLALRSHRHEDLAHILELLEQAPNLPRGTATLARARYAWDLAGATRDPGEKARLFDQAASAAQCARREGIGEGVALLLEGRATKKRAQTLGAPEANRRSMEQQARDALEQAAERLFGKVKALALAETADLERRLGGKPERVEELYRQATALCPDLLFAVRGYFQFLAYNKRLEQALPLGQRLVESYCPIPSDVALSMARCILACQRTDVARAIELLAGVLEREPDGSKQDPKLRLELAAAYEAAGDFANAYRVLQPIFRQTLPKPLFARAKALSAKLTAEIERSRKDSRQNLENVDELMTAKPDMGFQVVQDLLAWRPGDSILMGMLLPRLRAWGYRLQASGSAEERSVAAEIYRLAEDLAVRLAESPTASNRDLAQAASHLGKALGAALASRDRFHVRGLVRVLSDASERLGDELDDQTRQTLAAARAELTRQSSSIGPVLATRSDGPSSTRYPLSLIEEFLKHILREENLPIGKPGPDGRSPLDKFGPDPTFLVAMTGVGKTLAAPLRELLTACASLAANDADRRVYVVEPRIPICQGVQRFMEAKFRQFLGSTGRMGLGQGPLFGCITSATGRVNDGAPILFVTTGILESLTASGELDPRRHRVIIDEAHVTIERNPGVELCMALLRKRGVPVSYMSATVNTAGLAEELGVRIIEARNQRFPVLLRHFPGVLDRRRRDETASALEKLIRETLLEPSLALIGPVPGQIPERNAVVRDVRQALIHEAPDRAVGMLIVVNSHQSERSDTSVIAELIRQAPFNRGERRVEVLRLASEIVRNPEANAAFQERVAAIERRKGRYVIVATNIVEMGVTFSSIDFVVTLDSELDTVETPLGSYLRKTALSVNALYQRAGRAGRRRPGMCFIARDKGAPYTDLSPAELDARLDYERLRYPFQEGNVTRLALASFKEGVTDVRSWLDALPFPSAVREGPGWTGRAAQGVVREREKLVALGMAKGERLTARGRLLTKELVTVQLPAYAALVGLTLEDRNSIHLLEPLLVLAAAEDTGLFDLVRPTPEFRHNERRLLRHAILDEKDLGVAPSRVAEVLRGRGDWRQFLASLSMPEDAAARLLQLVDQGYGLANLKRGAGSESDDRYLNLAKEVVRLSPLSDVASIFQLVAYGYNQYVRLLVNPLLSPFEKGLIRRQAKAELAEIGVDFGSIEGICHRYLDLRKRLGVDRTRRRGAREESSAKRIDELLEEDVTHVLHEEINELLGELPGLLSKRQVGELAAELLRDLDKGDIDWFRWLDGWMKARGLRVDEEVFDRLVRAVIQPAVRSARVEWRSLGDAANPPELRSLDRRSEAQLVDFLLRSGCMDYFVLKPTQEGDYRAEIPGPDKQAYPLIFRPDTSPLRLREGAQEVRLLGRIRLVPPREEGQGEAVKTASLELVHATVAGGAL